MIEYEKIIKIPEEIFRQALSDRRYLHMYPELSFNEKNTMNYICSRLDKIGVKYRAGIANTGILAQIDGTKPGKCLLIRADMDALPVDEKNNYEYKSIYPGIMHACGHDIHTAILLNTCEVLCNLRDKIKGTVKFAFQPGEETSGGAKPMIADGILENPKVDAAVALHVEPELQTGKIRVKKGALYASPDDFYIEIYGKGAHGAEPQNSIDPIVIAAEIVLKLQTIVSRTISPFDKAVVSVGSIHAGDATNVIPDTARISGTARSLSEEIRNKLEKHIGEITKCVCDSYGADFDYRFERLYPPLVNDVEICELLKKSANRCLGNTNCICGGSATMAGEDFAYFCKEVPAALFKLGCGYLDNNSYMPIHSPLFDPDEKCIKYGIEIFTDFAVHYLG